jgi:GDP-mannose 6-dehydrogenase
MKISVFGLGYVGAVSLVCLARDGHEVTGVDINAEKLAMLAKGVAPIVEDGIQELTRDMVRSGRVVTTADSVAAIHGTDVSFVCVGTPSASSGAQDMNAVRRSAETIGAAIGSKPGWHTVVLRSTVVPGTTESVFEKILEAASGKKSGVDFGLCYQPEFLREGSSIKDYDAPPFTIVGSRSERSIEQLRSIFGKLPCEFVVTDVRAAEIMKMACNAFHAVKITFANEIGRVVKPLGIDGREIMRLLCKDTRLNISTAYLRPGFAFGGSCLPKDLRALAHLARTHDMEIPMMANVLPSNESHIRSVVDRILAEGRPRVAMLGLAFKQGTDDLRESPLVLLAEALLGKGLALRIFDPEVHLSRLLGANKLFIEHAIPHLAALLVDSPTAAAEGCDVLIVARTGEAESAAVKAFAKKGGLVVDLAGSVTPTGDERVWGVCW